MMDSLAGPRIRCRLTVNGFGETTEAGDFIIDYTGFCLMRGNEIEEDDGQIEP